MGTDSHIPSLLFTVHFLIIVLKYVLHFNAIQHTIIALKKLLENPEGHINFNKCIFDKQYSFKLLQWKIDLC